MANEGEMKRRLGRGLDALLGGFAAPEKDNSHPSSVPAAAQPASTPAVPAATTATAAAVSQTPDVSISDELAAAIPLPVAHEVIPDWLSIPVGELQRNPFQPRTDFEESGLKELTDSILQHGVLQPILVRKTDAGYQIVAGERRWLASQRAGLESVPCRVLTLEDQQATEAALEENLKRRDLNVLEKAQAFKDYTLRFDCSIEELGKRLSLDRSTVSNMMRLLELPNSIKALLLEEKITAGHAKAMLPLETDHQLALSERIQKEGLTVRETEAAVRELMRGDVEPGIIPIDSARHMSKSKPELTAHVQSLEQQFRDMLGLKVSIKLKTKEAGQFIVEFNSNDDFEKLTKLIRRAA